MRIPKSLEALADQGVIQEVLRPLMSGKEAQIYLVIAEDQPCAAKIYKDAQNRSFKNRADYTEGRKVRNSRDQRAMAKGSKYGKDRDEDTWKAAEVEMIYRLRAAGVRVPEPYVYIDGVLLMELVTDHEGNAAPRLGDLEFSPQEATEIYQRLIQETVRMLSAGVVHGDLSDFNVLLGVDGPVVIDFPQSINAAGNLNARSLLLRDVNNLHRFLQRWVPGARRYPYGEEMWELYEKNLLTAETKLTGKITKTSGPVDTSAVLSLIGDANRDEASRRRAAGQSTVGLDANVPPTPMRRREVIIEKPRPRASHGGSHGGGGPERSRRGGPDRSSSGPAEGRPPRSGPHSGGPRRDGPPRGGPSRGPSEGRGWEARRGGPPPRSDAKNRPRRGDAVPASTYVSPEARKTKVKALTPRGDHPERAVARSHDPDRSRNSRPSEPGDHRGRRSRRPPGEGPNAPRPTSLSNGRSEHSQAPRPSSRGAGDAEPRATPGMERRARRPGRRSGG